MTKKITRMDLLYLRFRELAKKNRAAKFLFVAACKVLRKDLTKKIREELPRALEAFVPEDVRQDKRAIGKLKRDIIENGYVYSMSPSEYFLFNFSALSDEEKILFVGDYEKAWLCQRLGKNREEAILRDKNETLRFFQQYFCRDAISVKAIDDREALFAFIREHNGAIVKESASSMGKDVTLVRNDPAEMEKAWTIISDTLQKGSSYIAEELIRQSEVMAAFHPGSVNTIRVMTFKTKDDVAFLGSVIRIGRGGSVVDNAGSGGILAEIDLEKGIVVGEGITEKGEHFERHPDTGVRIKGFAIPRWEELRELSKKLANMLTEQKYVGWDLALTDGGWVMVEGNSRAQFINQYPNRNGMRKLVRQFFYPELGLTKDY